MPSTMVNWLRNDFSLQPIFWRLAAVVGVAATFFASPAQAQLQWGATGTGGSGTWDGTTANWYNGTSSVVWDGNVANFSGTAGSVSMNSALSATGIAIATNLYTLSGTGTLTFTGSTPSVYVNLSTIATASPTVGVSFNLTSSSPVTFNANLSSSVTTLTTSIGGTNTFNGSLTFLSGSALTSGSASNGVAYVLSSTNTINGGLLLSGENLILTVGNSSSTAGGLTALNGTGTISVATTGTVFQVPKITLTTAGSGAVTIANNIVLNSNNLTGTFQTAFGATKPNAAASSYATNDVLIIAGNISGASDVYITTSITAGGGAGEVKFSGNNTYTGMTVVDLTGTSGGFVLGSNNALPATTALVFGNFVSSSNGVAPLDLNGFNATIASLATNTANGAVISAGTTGITNTASTVQTVTINGAATTTFSGQIGALNSHTAGVITGTNHIALVLGSGNTGSLTFTAVNSYTGGTTIAGGTLQAGIANAIPSGGVTLSGGTLSSGTGFSDSLGALSVTANSVIALGTTTAHQLSFTTLTYTGGTLSITGWAGTAGSPGSVGQLIFTGLGTTPSSANTTYASFLSNTSFAGFTSGSAFITNTAGLELVPAVPAPEPGSILAFLGAVGVVGGLRRIRK